MKESMVYKKFYNIIRFFSNNQENKKQHKDKDILKKYFLRK